MRKKITKFLLNIFSLLINKTKRYNNNMNKNIEKSKNFMKKGDFIEISESQKKPDASKKSKKNSKKVPKVKFDPKAKLDVDKKTSDVFERKGYALETMLGVGSFGQVFKAVRVAEPSIGMFCATKVMDLKKMPKIFKTKFLPRELAALMEISHPYIIRVFDIFRSNDKIYVFMEFADNGDIARYLRLNGPVNEARARYWFTQIVEAMYYLHERLFIVHRDIKIENILLCENNVAKLTDFGFACEAVDDEGFTILSETFCGTRPYYSPEILFNKGYNPLKADTWAMGVVLYILLHNKFPFHHKNKEQQQTEVLDPKYINDR